MGTRMYKALRAGMLLAAISALAGCERLSEPAERINAAMPLSVQAQQARQALLDDASRLGADTSALTSRLHDRLTMRALECNHGYSPRWWHGAEKIKTALSDADCFTRADDTLTQWLGLRHAGLLLAAPPLRPIPTTPAQQLIARHPIRDASFAAEAGIAVLHTSELHEVFDTATAQHVAQLPRGEHGSILDISRNGRLLTLRRGQNAELMDLEAGRVLARIPTRHPVLFLGTAGIIQRLPDESAPQLLDLATGHAVPIPVSINSIQAVSGTPLAHHHALMGSTHHALIAVEPAGESWQIRTVVEREYPRDQAIWQWPRGNRTADGEHYLLAQMNGLARLDLQTLQLDSTSLATLMVTRVAPTLDPARSYLVARNLRDHRATPIPLLHARKFNSITHADISSRLAPRVMWAEPYKRNAVIDDFKLTLLDGLTSTGPTHPIAAFLANQQQGDADATGGDAGNRPLATAALRPAAPSPTLGALPANAVIETVGVYEADGDRARHSRGPGQPRQAGTVRVMVKAGKPVILVLTAYEPVNWIIQAEPGATIAAVLHGGYHQGNVYGADTARQHYMGRIHTYRRGGSEFSELDREVRSLTGKGIGRFQGSYRAGHFRVGQ